MLTNDSPKKANEQFLQFIWKHKLYRKIMPSTDGKNVEIIKPGLHNTNAGADFLNAQVRIDDTLWAGDIEIHLRSSDWLKHDHHRNKAYDSVILHVVLEDDAEIFRTSGTQVSTVVLDFDEKYLNNYQTLLQAAQFHPIACADWIGKIDKFIIEHWFSNLLIDRLEQKSNQILANYEQNNKSWEETFYQTLARNFGFNLNADPFEMLAKSTPMLILAKHKDDLFQLEALLFGQAGMIGEIHTEDAHYHQLQREYSFLQHKYKLTPIEGHLWKFLRLRPSNFPTIRISQFAHLVHKSSGLFSKIIEAQDFKSIRELFEVEVSEYWKDHFVFHKKSPKESKNLGINAFQTIMINTVVPFMFVYGKHRDNEALFQQALNWLEQIPAEKNSIIDAWHEIGIKPANATQSQALLHLKKHFCDLRRCMDCSIGCRIIKE